MLPTQDFTQAMTNALQTRRQFAQWTTGAVVGVGVGMNVGGVAVQAQALPPLIVFAAASLTEVLQALAARLPDGNNIRFSFASSSTLAKQIEQGAPAHLFISADDAWMDHLVDRKAVDPSTRVNLADNRLVVVRQGAPAAQPFVPPETLAALREALSPQRPVTASNEKTALTRIATGDPAHVPVGRYAQAALKNLDLWSDVGPRLVRTDNVRSALSFVERGEVAAGIVYATDAVASTQVKVVARFPLGSHPAINYPAAMVSAFNSASASTTASATALATASATSAKAKAFLMAITSAASQPVWRAAGFIAAT